MRALITAMLVGLLWVSPLVLASPRSSSARHRFLVASGYPKGRPGYIVDHIKPLCLGGRDTPANMMWQPLAASLAKDREEQHLCAEVRRFLAKWTPRQETR